jgi:hypothetical protein
MRLTKTGACLEAAGLLGWIATVVLSVYAFLPGYVSALTASVAVLALVIEVIRLRREADSGTAPQSHLDHLIVVAKAVRQNLGNTLTFGTGPEGDRNQRMVDAHFPPLKRLHGKWQRAAQRLADAQTRTEQRVAKLDASLQLSGNGFRSFLMFAVYMRATGGGLNHPINPQWDERANGTIWSTGSNAQLVTDASALDGSARDALKGRLTKELDDTQNWAEVKHWNKRWREFYALRSAILEGMTEITHLTVLRGRCPYC